MDPRRFCIALAGGACATFAPNARATHVIDDRSFFDDLDHTFIDFETRADGTPLNLPFLSGLPIPPNEYAAFGFVFGEDRNVSWNDMPSPKCPSSCGVGDAVLAVGSLETVLGGQVGFSIHFTQPVHSFGIGVVQDAFVQSEASATMITAYDAQDNILGNVSLWNDLIDGGFNEFEEQYTLSYGFIGLAGGTPIARLEFTNNFFAVFDDFYFSSQVPAPGGAAMLGVALALSTRRRR